MLVIQNKQLQVFKDLALKKFEDEMVDHVQEFFPNHFMMMQESGVRNTIRYGYVRAKSYGFTTKRNVCLYLNTMLLLGSNFDYDPQYPWAYTMLNDEIIQHPVIRIDKLANHTLELVSQISGAHHTYLNRALLNLHNNADKLFEKLISSDLASTHEHLRMLFPRKCEVIGERNLQRMISYNTNQARYYGFTHEPNILMYTVFTFIMGSGFDSDPQFSWAGGILSDSAIRDQDNKVRLLYQKVISNLRSFISKIKP